MKRLYYPAVIDRSQTSYGINFPDFPGCVSLGDTPEEVMVSGAEALAAHVALMARMGDAIPDPSPLASVKGHPDDDNVCITLIAVIIPGKSRRINITLDEGLIEEIDAITSNRSGFLAEAARLELARRSP